MIFLQERKKEVDNDLTKEEEETPAEAVQEEMIKDISSEAEPTNVPELEPEDAIIPPPKHRNFCFQYHRREN